ncbi:Oligosaccharide translocation protein rft1, partial [Spiromyces aspiralis]
MTGVKYLVGLQVFSRLITFTMNQVILRSTSADVFGVVEVQLELLLSTILFLSREAFRVTLLRPAAIPTGTTTRSASAQRLSPSQQVVFNLAHLPLAIGVPVSVLACLGYYKFSLTDEGSPDSRMALPIALYGVAAVVELLAEPLFMLGQTGLEFKLRAQSEGLAIFCRCVVTLGCISWWSRGNLDTGEQRRDTAVVAFSLGRLAFGAALLMYYVCVYVARGGWGQFVSKYRLRPVRVAKQGGEDSGKAGVNEYYFDRTLLHLAMSMLKQSVLKHVLTEGDRMAVSVLCSAKDQGVYAAAANYGSLPARILFQPLEESCRTTLPKLVFGQPDSAGRPSTAEAKDGRHGSAGAGHQGIVAARRLLAVCLKLHVLLGLVFVVFGTQYAPIAVDLLLCKSEWITPLPPVLSAYCFYIPVMGVNGIMESFVAVIAGEREIAAMNRMMGLLSVAHIASTVVLVQSVPNGAIGLVVANSLNMVLRIA